MALLPYKSEAVIIVDGPVVTRAAKAPLAAVLHLATDVDCRVSVLVDDGIDVWKRDFYEYGTNHSLPLLGFRAGRTNAIVVTVCDRARKSITVSEPVYFRTEPLPAGFPTLTLMKSVPEKMEPGYTLFRGASFDSGQAYIMAVDNSGRVVWFTGPFGLDPVYGLVGIAIRPLSNGGIFVPMATNFLELNMLGEIVRQWDAPVNLPIELHDGFPTERGTIVYLNQSDRVVTNYPSSVTDSNAPTQTATVLYERVVEFSMTNSLDYDIWSPIDVLDPTRVGYLGLQIDSLGRYDNEHSNAVIEDPRDNSFIMSMRHQNAVVKFSRANGQLKWILGPHENWGPEWQPYLLTPVGSPFEWNYAQHAPVITPRGTLLLFDNGDFRASPFDRPLPDESNYSRVVEYAIDESTMEVSQVWEYGSQAAEKLYSPALGNAQWLPQRGNVLLDSGYVTYAHGTPPSPYASQAKMVRIQEVTYGTNSELVFDLALFDFTNTSDNYGGNWVYRSYRIPDLYAHPAQSVGDLTLRMENARPVLEFSAEPSKTYLVETSTNLIEWRQAGTAVRDHDDLFRFEDTDANQFVARHYRVVTSP